MTGAHASLLGLLAFLVFHHYTVVRELRYMRLQNTKMETDLICLRNKFGLL
ncbi:hypothetical protein PBI_BOBI_58 [Mycobacterium phage Bobi]|uniref:Uncharacterized protein n=2 Tax=Cheoctovirus TaxID=1623281 RepID=A0A249XP32_9CAUD|nr:membrane protein [Mycobacterium phage Bobi]YP_009956614.1 membrane protein [Mycobacterium phage Emma]YP_009960117.1 membrane protein [Mycobacterium phage Moonbeam]AGS82250.1 hypothetical protein PBI_BOBI_58 [Mycobacterium phage Bobi]ASZ72934.1 hypothetical protein SEA_EMMA_55 [Mycobacterium phage Emma]QNN98732.1 hypothetical protein PBI_MOONBEAM_51 [Mycobacterium phage Moonbeam]